MLYPVLPVGSLFIFYNVDKQFRNKRAPYVFSHIQTHRNRTVDLAVIRGNDWSAENHTKVFSKVIRQLINRGQGRTDAVGST